ncbi:MAG: hypothetical protein WA082_04155 [Candidatus Moraniibacteriota bacterium]
MQEKRRQEKTKPLPELKTSVTEILVVSGRSFQPFIRTFSSTGENISRANLGTLVGVFEIDDQSEDSAYIVNFLASVAKKEYFNNPRRGAVESFEAALHKINLALAELVKHGNITWLGKLHGALGVLEKNSFHFSITGHAKILLLRNGNLADIGEGLASEESHIHPIKTFVEVSSGRLTAEDQILLGSPEILALFSLEELAKHASRMDRERFTQFLKTALVNELDMSGLMVIDVSESTLAEVSAAKTKETAPVQTKNVFSQSAFAAKQPAAPSMPVIVPNEQNEKEADYIDTKTGHIYVQGDVPEAPARHLIFQEFWLSCTEHAASFLATQGKWLRKTKKQSALFFGVLNEQRRDFNKKIARAIRRQWRAHQEAKKERAAAQAALAATVQPAPVISVSDIPLPKKETSLPPEISENLLPEKEEATHQETLSSEPMDSMPQFLRDKLALFYQKDREVTRTAQPSPSSAPQPQTIGERFPLKEKTRAFFVLLIQKLRGTFQTISQYFQSLSLKTHLQRFFTGTVLTFSQKFWATMKRLSPRQKYLLLGSIGILFFATLGFLFLPSIPTTQTPETTSQSLFTELPSDTGESQNAITTILKNAPETPVTSVILNDVAYLITEKSIMIVSEKKSFPLPNGERVTFATAMDDLRLIFIATETGKLYAFSPLNKSFVENTPPLPENSKVIGIGTYLTYLYVLDSTTDQIYRFPRAPGGFGAATPWLKESVAIEENSHLAVSETIFVNPDTSTVKGFFRGRATSTFETPENGLTVTDLYTSPDLASLYALDSEHQSILVWNQDGKLLKTYTDPVLSEGTSLSVNEKQNEVFVTTKDSLLSFKLQ